MSLFGMFERRNFMESPNYPLTSTALAEVVSGPGSPTGIHVTPTKALTMSAVFRAVSLISGVSSALPLRTYRQGTHEPIRSTLLSNPHPDLTPLELWRLTFVHRCMWGNAYLQIVRDSGGKKQWLYPISPERVKVGKVAYSAANPSGKVFEVEDDYGKKRPFTSDEIFHLPGLGYDGVTGVSPIRLAAHGIGLGLAAEEYGARLFGSGSLMSGLLQTEQRLEQEQAEALKARWQAKVSGLRNSHEVAILDSGAKFQSMTMPNTDAQFLESRTFQTSEVGRFMGVPAFLMMDTSKSTSWGTGLEQQAIGWVTFDLHPQWLAPTEQRISKHLTDSSVDVKYSVGGLLRGDSTARAAFYSVMRNVGAYSANDIREFEDMSPVDGGDTYLQPLNMAPLGTEGTQADQPAPDGGQTP
jgi:HK97 family phage portal protein